MLQNTAVTRLQRDGWSADPEEARQQFEEHLREIGFRRPETKKRKRAFKVLPPATCWEEEFARTIPGRPLCAPDHFSLGVYPARRELAITFPHLQFNRTTLYRWLVLDIDRKSAAVAWRAAGLPPPNFTMTNPANGHAHVAWLLAVPVRGGDPAAASFRFLAMIESAYQRRLGADAAFCMHGQVKNPLHSDWETQRIFNTFRFANAAYSLRELAAPLRPDEMRPAKKRQSKTGVKHDAGLGRNCALFDELRLFAYDIVADFKLFGDQSGFVDQLRDQAMKLNSFIHPLPPSEVRTIVKSVAKYTWEEHEVFKAKQSARGSRAMAKRWAGHVTAAERAAAAGVSRATLYRQEKKLREKNSKAQV